MLDQNSQSYKSVEMLKPRNRRKNAIDSDVKEIIMREEMDYTGVDNGEPLYRILQQSQTCLISAQRIAHLGTWEWNMTTDEVQWSDIVYSVLGLQQNTTKPCLKSFMNVVHPDERNYLKTAWKVFIKGQGQYAPLHRIIRPDGSERIIQQRCEIIKKDFSDNPVCVIGIVQDVTELKLVESELRALSHRLVEIQEEYRAKIARELHDEVGQSLLYLKLMIDRLILQPKVRVKSELSSLTQIIGDLIAVVRNLSFDLRPGMIDELGILETLILYFQRYSDKTKVKVNFQHNGIEKRIINQHVSISIYRIIQESLCNVVSHANTNEVNVKLCADNTTIYLTIEDKGCGFNYDNKKLFLGISGMRERACLVGGNLSLKSTPGLGTCVTVQIPLK